MTTPRNLLTVLEGVPPWTPHVAGGVNDYDIKVANVAGEYEPVARRAVALARRRQHVHDDTDEVFLVLSGRLFLDLPDGTVTLGPMDVYTVPRGVTHRPRADDGTRILMVEPRGTSQDGTEQGSTAIRPT